MTNRTRPILALAAALLLLGCNDAAGGSSDGGTDSGTDSDADSDSDTDSDTGTDGGADAGPDCTGEDPFDPADCPSIDASDSRIRYVDVDAAAGGDGLAWGAAFTRVQDGIDAARCVVLELGGAAQVWVAEGIYYVFDKCLQDAIRLREGVELYGGFAGTEAAVDERDWVAHVATLDGHGSEGSADQVLHVVLGADAAAIDGFEIRGGNAQPPFPVFPIDDPFSCWEAWNYLGGGMAIVDGSPAVRNCSFADNSSLYYSGDVAVLGGSPSFAGCTFAGGTGGGILAQNAEAMLVADCSFVGAVGYGLYATVSSVELRGCSFVDSEQGAWMEESAATISSCRFSGYAYGTGLAVTLASDVAIENSVFSDNSADGSGAAVWVVQSSSVSIANSTFSGNSAGAGGSSVAAWHDGTTVTMANSIVRDLGSAPFSTFENATIAVTYSDIQGGYAGDGNIDADPLFADAAGGDFHLTAGSPCIDAADGDVAPEFDFDGESRWDDPDTADTGVGTPGYTDMGAYEWQGD